jgi:hypothetical protein
VHGRQELAPQHLARQPAQGLEPLGRPLDLLAVEGDHHQVRQARRQRVVPPGPEPGEPESALPQQRHRQFQREPPQLLVDVLDRHRQRPGLPRRLEAGVAAAPVHQQGVAQQVDHLGEGQLPLVAAAAVPLEQVVEAGLVQHVREQFQHRPSQREPRQRLDLKAVHGMPSNPNAKRTGKYADGLGLRQ